MQTHTIVGEEMLAQDRRSARRGRTHRPFVSRALGRSRLPRRPRRRAHPARGADHLRVRRVERDDDRPLLPPGTEPTPKPRRSSARAQAPSSTRRSSRRSKPSSRADLQPERLRERGVLIELRAKPGDVARAERHRPAARRPTARVREPDETLAARRLEQLHERRESPLARLLPDRDLLDQLRAAPGCRRPACHERHRRPGGVTDPSRLPE